MTEFQERVIEACDEGDFMVGRRRRRVRRHRPGRSARVRARRRSPRYAVSAEAAGADLSIQPLPNPANELSIGSFRYLEQTVPGRRPTRVGILAANIQQRRSTAARYKEAITTQLGWKVVYEGEYNALGETSWRPFIEAMRGARGPRTRSTSASRRTSRSS